YQARAKDDDNDPLTWRLLSGPATASIDANGLFTWDPGADEIGQTQTAIIQVSDPYGPGQQQGITLRRDVTSTPGNTAPRITSTPPLPGSGGQTYSYLVRAQDDEGQRITLKIAPGANLLGTSFVDNGDGTATFVWTNPTASESRSFTF